MNCFLLLIFHCLDLKYFVRVLHLLLLFKLAVFEGGLVLLSWLSIYFSSANYCYFNAITSVSFNQKFDHLSVLICKKNAI